MEVIELPLLTKKEVAREILKQIEMMLEDDASMKFASVIVDVPARQTDRPFDYIILKMGRYCPDRHACSSSVWPKGNCKVLLLELKIRLK